MRTAMPSLRGYCDKSNRYETEVNWCSVAWEYFARYACGRARRIPYALVSGGLTRAARRAAAMEAQGAVRRRRTEPWVTRTITNTAERRTFHHIAALPRPHQDVDPVQANGTRSGSSPILVLGTIHANATVPRASRQSILKKSPAPTMRHASVLSQHMMSGIQPRFFRIFLWDCG